MKLAVIGAMKKEIDFLLKHLENHEVEKKLNHLFYCGSIAGKEMVVVESGIGKVASGILFSALINSYPDLDLVINIGVAGGVKDKVEIGDIVVAEQLAYADVDVRPGGDYYYGQIPNCPLYFSSRADIIKRIQISHPYKTGTILSGDSFFVDIEDVSTLIKTHFPNQNVLALDMESAAFGQSAWFYGIPFIAIRAISDVIGYEAQFQSYLDNLELAATNSNLFLLEVIKKIG